MNLSNKSTFLLAWFCTGDFGTKATVFHYRLYNMPQNQTSPSVITTQVPDNMAP